jgi:hypothetical protein
MDPKLSTDGVYAALNAKEADKAAIKQAIYRFRKNADALSVFTLGLDGNPMDEAD